MRSGPGEKHPKQTQKKKTKIPWSSAKKLEKEPDCAKSHLTPTSVDRTANWCIGGY